MKYKKLFLTLLSRPIKSMRYASLGDWEKHEGRENTTLFEIVTAQTGNQDYDFLILLHELIEAYLCHRRGISQKQVDAFDMGHPELDDPGLDSRAPYYKEHAAALEIEAAMSVELNVDWKHYEDVQTKVLTQYVTHTTKRAPRLVEHHVPRRPLGKTRKKS